MPDFDLRAVSSYSGSYANLRLYDVCHLLGVTSFQSAGLPPHFRFFGWRSHPVVYLVDELVDAFMGELSEAARRPFSPEDDHYERVAPPHPVFMVEARVTVDALKEVGLWFPSSYSMPAAGDPRAGWVAVGASTSALRLSEASSWHPHTRDFVSSFRSWAESQSCWHDPEWISSSRTICWAPQVYPRPVGWTSAHISQVDGGGREFLTYTQTVADFLLGSEGFSPDSSEVVFYSGLGVVAQALMMRTLEFLSARNVEEVSHRSLMPRQLRRSVERRDGFSYLPQFRTLQVRHGRYSWPLTTMGGVGRPLLKPEALALVRGHFKTYSEESPLFGRHVGTWYWPPHLRSVAESAGDSSQEGPSVR